MNKKDRDYQAEEGYKYYRRGGDIKVWVKSKDFNPTDKESILIKIEKIKKVPKGKEDHNG